MKIFLDLDGTLFDSRDRLYNLFCDLTGQSLLTFEDYWELKRNMYDHKFILTEFLNYSANQIESFSNEWMQEIETEKYLEYDFPFEFTMRTLKKLKDQKYLLYLITARQSKKGALYQLDKYNMTSFFDGLFVTENKLSKIDLLKKSKITFAANDVFCGDTGLDIITGKSFQMRTIGVLSGFRSRPFLKKYAPDYIINNIGKLNETLEL